MSPGRLWLEFRRDLRRGAKAAWNHRIVAPRIVRWQPMTDMAPAGPGPVHVVGGRDHLLLGAWMLVSLFHHSGRRWQVVWHEDGREPLPVNHLTDWMKSVLGVRFVSRVEADQAMQPVLAGYPLLRDMRQRLPLMLKLMDVRLIASDPRVFLFDPDVLFFRPPTQLMEWADDDHDESIWFNAEQEDPSYLNPETVEKHLGKPAWKGFNSGLGCFPLEAIDLDRCEEWLAAFPELQGDNWGNNWRVEQSLYALCAAAHGKGGLLPQDLYEVHHQPKRNPQGIARHYVGAVRDLFWSEGVDIVKKQLQYYS